MKWLIDAMRAAVLSGGVIGILLGAVMGAMVGAGLVDVAAVCGPVPVPPVSSSKS